LEEECPSADFGFILDLRFFCNPVCDLLVAGSGGNEGFELLWVDLSEPEEGLVERAIEMIGAGGGG
jgi:hypothetical protein